MGPPGELGAGRHGTWSHTGGGGLWETHSFPTASPQLHPVHKSHQYRSALAASKEAFISEDKDYSLVLTHAIGKRE